MTGFILVGSLLLTILAVWFFGERWRPLRRSTWHFLREAGLRRLLNGSALHAYAYGRWTNQYIDTLLHRIYPRLDARSRQRWADHYHGKVLTPEHARAIITLNEEIPLQDLEQIIPYPVARDIVLNGPPEVAVYECGCRHARANHCEPTQVCMIIGQPFVDFVLEHNPQSSRRLTQSEALTLLQAEHERGHVHSAWFKDVCLDRFYVICNCCQCCCGGIEAMTKYDIPIMVSSGYVAQVDEMLCTPCGICEEACPFKAITVDGEATVGWESCMGCGVCVVQCPTEAILLVRDERKGEPLDVKNLEQRTSPSTPSTLRRFQTFARLKVKVGVPHTLQPYPRKTLLDVVSETTLQRPNHQALFFKGAQVSYAQLERESDAFAAALLAQGVAKGDRVALLLPNCPQAIVAQFGAWKAGAIVAPLNPLYTERELVHALNECGAETAVVLTPFYAKLKALQPRTPLQRIIATNIKEYLPPLLRLLFTLFKEKKEGHRVALQPGDSWFGDLLRRHADAPRPDVSVEPDDPALLLFTGGTTGTPKAALSTHQALLMSGMQFKAWFGKTLVDWEDSIMANMPLFHTYGQVGVMTTGLVGHHPLVLVPNPRDLDDVLATIRKARPAFLPGVPTLFIALLDHPEVQAGKADLRSLKLCISGAAPLLTETKQRFEALTGGRIVEGYALTESVMACVLTPVQGTYKPGAVGLPLPDVEIRIVDADTGQTDLPASEVGEVLIRAPQLMVGYWRRPEETANTIRDGWLYTGDLGCLDEDGYLAIVDRKKDVIKPSGFQVWPREVEEIIAAHPAVAEVGVAGVPDERQGEAVKAWVVLREGEQIAVDELRAFCKERLAAYKVPRYVEFRSELPKSMVGKVLRRELVAAEGE